MDNAYLGVDILTESMQRLGLENTFIVTPYEEPDRAGDRGTGRSAGGGRTCLGTETGCQRTGKTGHLGLAGRGGFEIVPDFTGLRRRGWRGENGW